MHAQALVVMAAAGLVAAAPAATSCPYYSGLAPFTANSGCASAYCEGIVAKTVTTTTTLSPGQTITKTEFTMASPTFTGGSAMTVTDYTTTVTSTIVAAQTEASFVFPSIPKTTTTQPPTNPTIVQRRQNTPPTSPVSPISCPEITAPPPQDLSSASAACACYVTTPPIKTVTVTQGAPGQCGAAPTVTTTITQTPSEVEPTGYVTVDAASTTYFITGATAYTTVACSSPVGVAALPTCTGDAGSAQQFGIQIAACGSPYDNYYFQPQAANVNPRGDSIVPVKAVSSSSFIGPFFDQPGLPTHEEYIEWIYNGTNGFGGEASAFPITDDTTANNHLLSTLAFHAGVEGFNTLECGGDITGLQPWQCATGQMYQNLNWFVRHSDDMILVGTGGLVDTQNYTQVQPFHVPLCNLSPANQPPSN